MNRYSTLLPICSLLFGMAPGFAQAVSPSDYPDVHALALEMRRLEHVPAPNDLPPVWHLRTPSGNFDVSTAPVTSAASIEDAHRWLGSRAAQLEGFDRPRQTSTNAAPALRHILAGPSFREVQTHHWWDAYRRRFNAWIARLLDRLFAFIGRSPVGGRFVFWAALASAIALLGYWLVTVLGTEATGLGLSGTGGFAAIKRSEDWIGDMERARSSGDYRKAIQCAYWAAVARLQSSGALPLGAALTPREYLRQAATPATGPLRALTASLERFWYGGAGATADDVSLCLASLKEIGWRID